MCYRCDRTMGQLLIAAFVLVFLSAFLVKKALTPLYVGVVGFLRILAPKNRYQRIWAVTVTLFR
jgi:hypothetical protein